MGSPRDLRKWLVQINGSLLSSFLSLWVHSITSIYFKSMYFTQKIHRSVTNQKLTDVTSN